MTRMRKRKTWPFGQSLSAEVRYLAVRIGLFFTVVPLGSSQGQKAVSEDVARLPDSMASRGRVAAPV